MTCSELDLEWLEGQTWQTGRQSLALKFGLRGGCQAFSDRIEEFRERDAEASLFLLLCQVPGTLRTVQIKGKDGRSKHCASDVRAAE